MTVLEDLRRLSADKRFENDPAIKRLGGKARIERLLNYDAWLSDRLALMGILLSKFRQRLLDEVIPRLNSELELLDRMAGVARKHGMSKSIEVLGEAQRCLKTKVHPYLDKAVNDLKVAERDLIRTIIPLRTEMGRKKKKTRRR